MSQKSFKKERDPSILILDFGSQYSELIARRIRETNVFSLVVSNFISIEDINKINPKGIILSGGPNSVYEPVSYTHLPSPRDRQKSRMPSSA